MTDSAVKSRSERQWSEVKGITKHTKVLPVLSDKNKEEEICIAVLMFFGRSVGFDIFKGHSKSHIQGNVNSIPEIAYSSINLLYQ